MAIVVAGKPINIPVYRLLIILLAIGFGLMLLHFYTGSTTSTLQPVVGHGHVRSPWIRNVDYFNYSVYDQSGRRIPDFSAAGFWPTERNDERLESYEIKSCLSPDLQKHEEATCRFHAVMMDAGSTGTRVHIFEFSHDVHDSAAPFKLEKEVYHQVTPGLSFYMNNPKQAAESIVPLLNKAKSTVPKSQWKHTPISLKATAGLRLVSAEQADNIIAEVDRLLDETGFLTNDESVSIMSGIDEGIFGWFTLNFLLDRLGALKQEPINDLISRVFHKSHIGQTTLQTAAALDLGGGSTQVTFRPKLNSTLIRAPDDFIRQIKLVGRFVDLYTHSYLGNGLMAARLASLKIANTAQLISNNSSLNFFTSCLPPHFSLLWKYNEVVYNVSGKSPYNFKYCLTEQQSLTNLTIIDQPVELADRDLYVFGYFFDLAKQSGITSGNGGYATIADFLSAAKKSCTKRRLGRKDHEQWRCRDLSYIIALLRAYNLPENKKFYLARRIHNMEVSWALGASYHLLNSYHESKKSRLTTSAISVQLSKPNADLPPFGPCICERMFFTTGGVLKGSAWLNLSTYFFCSRIYYGLIGILPSTFAHLA